MTPNKLIKILIFLTSTLTFISNGIIMLKEKDTINFQSLNKNQDLYVGLLIYTEIYIGIILLYNLLYYIYEQFYNCCNDNRITTSFSFFKTIFLLTGLVTHMIIAYYLISNKNYIDNNINTISIIFTSNLGISLFIILIINIYKKYSSTNEEERLIN